MTKKRNFGIFTMLTSCERKSRRNYQVVGTVLLPDGREEEGVLTVIGVVSYWDNEIYLTSNESVGLGPNETMKCAYPLRLLSNQDEFDARDYQGVKS